MQVRTKYKQTAIGQLPEDWELVNLGERSMKVGSGITPTGGSKVYKEFGRPFVRSQNIGWGELLLDDIAFISDEIHQTFSATEIELNDVLLNITGASIGRSAVANRQIAGGNVNQHVCIIRPIRTAIDSKFLNCFLLSQQGQRQIDSCQAGGNRQGLNFVQIRSFVIPAPPLSEQCAIAVAISDIEALINSLERLIAKKTDIKQAAMQQLLTGKTRLPGFKKKDGFKHSGIGLIPQDWDVKTLGELGTFKNGINKGQEDFGHGFPFVNLMDVFGKPRVSNDADFGLVNSSTAERKMYELNKDDVLFVRSSVKPDGVGLTTFVCQDLPNTVFSGFLIRFRPSGHLAGEFMEHCFANQEFRKRVISSSTVSANTNINQHALRALALAFPPDKHEQIAIGTYLSDMDAELSRLAERRDKTLLIKQGMVQELLTGRTRLI